MVFSAQRKTIARGLAESGVAAATDDQPFAHKQQPPLTTPCHGHIPGYQGYICRSQHLHGKTYGNITREAAMALPHDHHSSLSPKKQLRLLSTVTTEMLHGKDTIILGQPRRVYDYKLCENEPCCESRLITGYSGFIRGSQHYFGTNFPDVARIAKDHQYDKADADPVKLPADRLPGYAGVRPCALAQAM